MNKEGKKLLSGVFILIGVVCFVLMTISALCVLLTMNMNYMKLALLFLILGIVFTIISSVFYGK